MHSFPTRAARDAQIERVIRAARDAQHASTHGTHGDGRLAAAEAQLNEAVGGLKGLTPTQSTPWVQRMESAAGIVLAQAGTVSDTDRKNAAVRLAELVLGFTDSAGR